MSKNIEEPSLHKIDDYNGKETKQKRNSVRTIVILLLIFGAVLAYVNLPKKELAKDVYEKTQIPLK